MKSPRRCVNCNVVLPVRDLPEEAVQYSGLWMSVFFSAQHECPHCRKTINLSKALLDHRVVSWVKPMLDDGDYDVVFGQNNSSMPRLRSRTWAFWVWHPPLDHDHSQMACNAIRESDRLRATSVKRLVILPAGSDQTPWMHLAASGPVDEIWQVKGDLTKDASGPYPSFKAETVIATTMASLGVEKIVHFWPAVVLPKADYFSLMSASDLRASYSRKVRQALEVE
jgi:hypothetical protein